MRRAETALDQATVTRLRAIYAGLPKPARAQLHAEADAGDMLAAMMVSAVLTPPATTPCAWRLYSRRLDRELWIVKDAAALAELDAARGGLPVIVAADLARLRGLDDLTLNCLLDTAAVWPGVRVADAMPEGGVP